MKESTLVTRNAPEQMQEITLTTYMDAPREEVWPYMADLPFLAVLPFTTMEVSGRPVGVGTVYRWAFAPPFGLAFRFDEMVTEWVENERIAYRATSGWEMAATVVLAPQRGGTRAFHSGLPVPGSVEADIPLAP